MKKIKISLIINIIIVLLVIMTSIFMFTGFTFMKNNTLLEASKIEMFKFYTVDSNILIGIASLLLAINEIKLLNKKIKEIPIFIYILKLITTSGITLTFITTAFFLAPQYGIYAMYNNNNLFFHLIIPILSIITYVIYEKYDNKYKYAPLGMLPMFIYSIYYTTNIILHLNTGGLSFKSDFYGFLQGNINNIYIVIPFIYFVTYLISLLLIFLNKNIKSNQKYTKNN